MASGESTTYPKDSEVLPPSRKVKWPANREHFWANWRVSSKKTNETIYAECKLCSDGKFYIGNMGLFSNFSQYVARKHEKEYEIFVKSDLIWFKAAFHEYLHHSIGNCEKETNWAWKIMGKLFIRENIPLNLVRSQLFRDFCKLSISCVF